MGDCAACPQAEGQPLVPPRAQAAHQQASLLAKGYVLIQAVVYLLVILLFSARAGVGRARTAVEWVVLAIAKCASFVAAIGTRFLPAT